ncbi:hypothetical protein [Rhizobium sp. PP-CC-3G-465]|uniref:hypothetical protein n=1 Tax=Rhizobium sp. PP-CC-3G-465 TaxID=2135648 RepID=UPI0010DB136F|nr:hypothetical protein C8J33_10247 [Rhizobium sp. PP-CC-3G-465]
MSAALGPYVQMVKLAQQMALMYQADRNLDLGLLVSHYVEEVEVNVRSDTFDHLGFIDRIRGELSSEAAQAGDGRRGEYLRMVVEALHACAGSLPSALDAEPFGAEKRM